MTNEELESLADAKEITVKNLLDLENQRWYFENIFTNCAPLMRDQLREWTGDEQGNP